MLRVRYYGAPMIGIIPACLLCSTLPLATAAAPWLSTMPARCGLHK